jgi:hypothetical protein
MAKAMAECQIVLQAKPERFVQYRWPYAGELSGHLREQVRMRKGAPGEGTLSCTGSSDLVFSPKIRARKASPACSKSRRSTSKPGGKSSRNTDHARKNCSGAIPSTARSRSEPGCHVPCSTTEPNGITRLAPKRCRKTVAQRVASSRASCCWMLVVLDIMVVHLGSFDWRFSRR